MLYDHFLAETGWKHVEIYDKINVGYSMHLVGCFIRRRLEFTSSYLSLRVSVCPHGTTQLLLEGFLLNLIFGYFSKTCREDSSLIKVGQE